MEIFVKTYHKDFDWLRYLFKSLEKYARGFSGITLVSDNDGYKIPKDIIYSIRSIPLEIVYLDLPNTQPKAMPYDNRGYYWQQIVKLNWWRYCSQEVCIQIDSDCMVRSEISPEFYQNNDGKWIYNIRPWSSMNNDAWKESTEKLLKIKLENQGMIGRSFVLTKECTQELIKHITGQGYDDLTWDFIVKNSWNKFSEYCLYGGFVENIYKGDSYELRIWNDSKTFHKQNTKIVKHKSWKGLTPEIIKEYESYL